MLAKKEYFDDFLYFREEQFVLVYSKMLLITKFCLNRRNKKLYFKSAHTKPIELFQFESSVTNSI